MVCELGNSRIYFVFYMPSLYTVMAYGANSIILLNRPIPVRSATYQTFFTVTSIVIHAWYLYIDSNAEAF